MSTVSTQVKWFAVTIIGTMSIGVPAQAAFHLDHAYTPKKGIVSRLLTPAKPPAPASDWQLAGRSSVLPIRIVEPIATNANDSTNRFVDPWGCEADTAQDVSSSGKYWGKYQFDRSTWIAHGGSPGSYGNAPEAEQDAIAAKVTYDAWPNC